MITAIDISSERIKTLPLSNYFTSVISEFRHQKRRSACPCRSPVA